MKITLRSDLKLQTCGQKANPNLPKSESTHKKGCYIRFKEGKSVHSKPRDDCVVDYDENGEIIGIEFYDGL
jgi:hypothetical protein